MIYGLYLKNNCPHKTFKKNLIYKPTNIRYVLMLKNK